MSPQSPNHDLLTVLFIPSDGIEKSIPVSFQEAKISNLVKNIIEEEDNDDHDNNGDDSINIIDAAHICSNDHSSTIQINLPNVKHAILQKIIDFMKHYYLDPLQPISYPFEGSTLTDIIQQEWYIAFVMNNCDGDCSLESPSSSKTKTLFQIIDCANYMDIQPLFDLGCLFMSTMIMDKSSEEIRNMLKIEKLSASEELKAREEHEWMFS